MPPRRAPSLFPWLPMLLVAIATSSACSRPAGDEGQLSGEVIAVTVSTARMSSVRDIVTAGGMTVPAAAADFVVTALEASEVLEVPKGEGEAVQAGDLLVKLELPSATAELTARQLELAEATLKYERAKADEERLRRLHEQGVAARNQWEAARTALTAAETVLNQTRVRFDTAKSLQSRAEIRAPFAGVLLKRWHNPGDMVLGGEGDPIVRLIDPARLQVALQVPIEQADRIAVGQVATVVTGTGNEAATVVSKAAQSGSAASAVEVRLGFLTPTTTPVDAIVQAEVVVEEQTNVLVVPAGAVQRDESGTFVWLATESDQASRRPVRVGITATGVSQILSGLLEGDRVITTGIAQLSEGVAISISRRP